MADVKHWYDRATISSINWWLLHFGSLAQFVFRRRFEEQDLLGSENCARFWLAIIKASIWQWSSSTPDNWTTTTQHSSERQMKKSSTAWNTVLQHSCLFFEIMLYKNIFQMSMNLEICICKKNTIFIASELPYACSQFPHLYIKFHGCPVFSVFCD